MIKKLLALMMLFSNFSYGQTFADYAKLGFDAQIKKDYSEAIVQYKKAQKIEPSNVIINSRIGLMFYYSARYDSAIVYYNIALEYSPNDTNVHYQRGFAYLDGRLFQKALDDFMFDYKLNNKNPEPCFNIGKSYAGLGDYDKAIEFYRKTLNLLPNDKSSFYEIGFCFASYTIPIKDSALKYYNKAIDMDNKYYEAYFNRGLLYYKQFKNFKMAHKDLETSIQIQPNNHFSYLYNGMIYLEENEYSSSKEMYNKVIEIYPDFAQAYYERARAWLGIGVLNMVCKDLDKSEALGYNKAAEAKKQFCK